MDKQSREFSSKCFSYSLKFFRQNQQIPEQRSPFLSVHASCRQEDHPAPRRLRQSGEGRKQAFRVKPASDAPDGISPRRPERCTCPPRAFQAPPGGRPYRHARRNPRKTPRCLSRRSPRRARHNRSSQCRASVRSGGAPDRRRS